jgi:predicted ATPase
MKLLERQEHLDELHTILASTGKEGGRLVLVSGEAGIGKTSLVGRFLSEQLPRQAIFTGACDNMFAPRPFGPIYEIAQPALPELAAALQQRADSLEAARVLLDSLVRLKDPSIFVIEDVHWADEATLDVLKYVGRRIRQTRTLLLLTYRDDEIGPAHPLRILLGELAASSPPTRIRLRDLSQEAVRELASGTGIDPVVLHQQTSGNPFFITEALNSQEGGIPQTVRDAVLARASRLSPDGRAVLDAAAVLGPRIEVWLLEKMDSYSPAAVDECLATGVLRGQSEYLLFRHELSRQAVL